MSGGTLSIAEVEHPLTDEIGIQVKIGIRTSDASVTIDWQGAVQAAAELLRIAEDQAPSYAAFAQVLKRSTGGKAIPVGRGPVS